MSKYSNNSEKNTYGDENINKNQNFTDTNMMVEFFANSAKLVDTDKRIYYGNSDYNNVDDVRQEKHNDDINYGHLDDDLESYKKTRQNNDNDNIHNQNVNNVDEQNVFEKNDVNNGKKDQTESIDEKQHDPDDESQWTKEELLMRKLDMLRKLGELSKCGVKISQNYSMNSDYKTMKYEYELHDGIRSKHRTVSWMSGMMIGIVRGIELLNDNYNPFDMKFDNVWSNDVTTNISDYYDILGEIYEKYTTPGKKMAPELRLFLALSGSAITIQMHKGISNMTSKASKQIDSNPDLLREMRQKADQAANDKINQEHKVAADKAAERASDLNMLNTKNNEFLNMQKMATTQNMEKINNALILSDSVMSKKHSHKSDSESNNSNKKSINIASEKSSHSKHNQENQDRQSNAQIFMKQQHDHQKQTDLMSQNKKLLVMQQMLQNMKNEQRIIDSVKSKKSKTESDVSSNSASSMSSISVNPNLDSILGKSSSKLSVPKSEKPSKKKSTDSDEVSSNSTISTKSLKNKKSISLNIEDKLKEFEDKSQKITPVKSYNKDTNDITFESISFGKKSVGSNGSKRGRPKKNSKTKSGN